MLISCEADLDAALANHDPYLWVDGSTEIQVTTPKVLDYPVIVHGGRFHAEDGPILIVTSSDVVITGGWFTGGLGGTPSYSAAQKLIYVLGQQGSPLTGVAVRDCTLRDSCSDNVWMQWTNGALVAGCSIRDFLYSGVMGISSTKMLVQGNHISNGPLIPGGPVNVYGIAFTDLDNTEQARSIDCTAVGNVIDRIDWEGLDTHGGDGISFVGNTITSCPRGIAFVSGNETRLAVPTRSVASGNTIDGKGSRQPLRSGIWLAGLPGNPSDGTVTGNQIDGYAFPIALDYVNRARLRVEANSVDLVPWTNITLGPDFKANDTFPPRYMVDGNTVRLSGMVIPRNSTRKIIGRLDSTHAWPQTLTFLGETHGSGGGSAGRFLIGVWGSDSADYPPGTIQAFYPNGSWTDTYSYPLFGSYQAV